jgi:DNA-binding phage protein
MSPARKGEQKVREDLRLHSEPTDEFMLLIAEANALAANERPAPVSAKAILPGDLEAEVQRATAGALLAQAKAHAGRSLSEIGKRAGLTKQRVAEILDSENLEVDTIARLAAAMGYELGSLKTESCGK